MSVLLAIAAAAVTSCLPGPESDIVLSKGNSTARICLDGARVSSYVADGREVLWNCRVPPTSREQWVHVGLPVCWPVFGKTKAGQGFSHGFLRTLRFAVVESANTGNVSRVALEAKSDDGTRRLWPHDFTARLEADLSDSLSLRLMIRNDGTDAFAFSVGFHSYFRVSERDAVSLRRLDGRRSFDLRAEELRAETWRGDMRIDRSCDRLFDFGNDECLCELVDPGFGRRIVLKSQGLTELVVWNPGAERVVPKVPEPGNLSEGDWRHFVCVEPAVSGRMREIALPAGAQADFLFEIRSESLQESAEGAGR